MQHRRGFTLVELLTVVAIIGIIGGFSLTAIGKARVRARDDQRIRDLKSIQTALELYRADLDRSTDPADNGLYGYPSSIYGDDRFAKYLTYTPIDSVRKTNYVYFAPGCLHPAYGNNGQVVVSPAVGGFKTVAEIKAQTGASRSCPLGSGWLPYVVYGLLEQPISAEAKVSRLANLANSTQAVAYSVIKPIFVDEAEANSTTPSVTTGSFCYPASANCPEGPTR